MSDRSDFIVVGAGSAGCVVARALAEAGYHVRLIEATPEAGRLRRRPAEYLQAIDSPEDWGYQTLAQPQLANRSLRWPRGRGLGGSTRINAMIWYPPRSIDLQMLHAHGGDLWSPEAVLQSLQEITRWVRPQKPPWLSAATECFLQVRHNALEVPFAFARMSAEQGRRTAADLLAEATLHAGAITTERALVDRVLLSGDRAIGIEVCAGDGLQRTQWYASRGVILCGGSIASPSILMRSGIGPADVLADAGVPLRCNLPAVGQRLADHLIMPVVFAMPAKHRFPAPFSTHDLARWQVAQTGPLSSNLAEAGAIGWLSPSDALQIHFTPTHYLLHPNARAPAALTIGVNLCHPASRGQIRIESPDPTAPPWIDPNYLSEQCDWERLADAVEIARELAAAAPLCRLVQAELVPGAQRASRDGTIKAIRRFAQTLYHPTGTCSLGTGPESVVDPQCRVRGCAGLFIIDASVLPEIPSVNPNATIMTIALHAAREIAASFRAR